MVFFLFFWFFWLILISIEKHWYQCLKSDQTLILIDRHCTLIHHVLTIPFTCFSSLRMFSLVKKISWRFLTMDSPALTFLHIPRTSNLVKVSTLSMNYSFWQWDLFCTLCWSAVNVNKLNRKVDGQQRCCLYG